MELRGVDKHSCDSINDKVTKFGFASRELVFIVVGFLVGALILFIVNRLLVIPFIFLFIYGFNKASRYFKDCAKKGIQSPLEYKISSLTSKKKIEQLSDFKYLLKNEGNEEKH